MNLFLLLILLAVSVVALSLTLTLISMRTKFNDFKKEHERLESTCKTLQSQNEELSVYSNALDADKEAEERLENAKLQAEQIIVEARDKAIQMSQDINKRLKDRQEQAEKIKKDNQQLIQNAEEYAKNIKEAASKQATYILGEARKKAKDIAGEAYEIANNAKSYQDLATAMKNIVEGYGDEYLKPAQSLLDDLAEEFGYDDAGKSLKEARDRSRSMMKNHQAAMCDYVEANRKDTAINFITDAFNGKVDTIMSLIKKDNYGILEQKIKDAYSLVNHLGKAFRNARITPEYLDARLHELTWGCIVVEMKIQEREEQRRIKEQIREEEKARKEYEKAMRDAAKEEDMIRKAMEKAQQAIAKANEEQKMKYETQLAELELKLKEAEEKNQRALSMAQQTKSGHVYVISNIGSFGENVYKIGMTRRLEPMDRVRELGDASVPFPFDVHAMIYSEDAPSLETDLHKIFVKNQVNKVNPRKEFFRIPLAEIRKLIEERKIEAKWTMAADAQEYRETVSIEKAMASEKGATEKWIEQQEKETIFEDEDE